MLGRAVAAPVGAPDACTLGAGRALARAEASLAALPGVVAMGDEQAA
jgi:hypothetical protein